MESRSSILRISDAKTIELIDLYAKEECLWNTELPNYRNRAVRHAAVERIAKKLAIDRFDIRHVTIKFKNLRNSYCQELKKAATSQALGEDPEYRPKVFWFDKMDAFLRPHLQQLHPWNCDAMKEDKNEIYLEEPATELTQMVNPNDAVMVKLEVMDDDDAKPPTKRPRPKYLDDSDNSSGCGYSHSEPKARCTQPRGDCFDVFGKYVSSMLRMMPKQKATELQPKIVALLTAVEADSVDEHVSQSDDNSVFF